MSKKKKKTKKVKSKRMKKKKSTKLEMLGGSLKIIYFLIMIALGLWLFFIIYDMKQQAQGLLDDMTNSTRSDFGSMVITLIEFIKIL